jgi:hypothetical protein
VFAFVQIKLAVGLADCVDDFHRANFVHGELSIDSVIMTTSHTVALAELGSKFHMACYAPEQLEANNPTLAQLSVDIWGLAVTLLHAWTGKEPCKGWKRQDLLNQMRQVCGSHLDLWGLMTSSSPVLVRCESL